MRLFFLGILLVIAFSAEAGPRPRIPGTTAPIKISQIPNALSSHKGDLVIVKISSRSEAGDILFKNNLKKDSISDLKTLIDSGIVAGFRILYLDFKSPFCPITRVLELGPGYDTVCTVYTTPTSRQKGFDIVDFTAQPGKPAYQTSIPTRLCRTSGFEWIYAYNAFSETELKSFRTPKLWILSVGIDDYGQMQFSNCKSDAKSFSDYFISSYNSFARLLPGETQPITAFVLLDKNATKDSILGALKSISRDSSPEDYFIFNFAGFSIEARPDFGTEQTYFAGFGWKGYPKEKITDHTNLISLNELKEYLEFMPVRNQLFLTESGPTANFRQEFISTLLNKNLELENLLNKNRVIIVPNGMGKDDVSCGGEKIRKGPLNHYITSLESQYNIFDLFGKDKARSSAFTHQLYEKQYQCPADASHDYFSIFFEKEFMSLVHSLSGTGMQMRSGRNNGTETSNTKPAGYGKKYALVIGNDTYQASKEWGKLPNAVYDAKEVAIELEANYGYEVDTLFNPTMNEIYKKLWEYSAMLGSTDQFLFYVAGHGDYDSVFLDDGVIVCSDSKLSTEDISRNSYIPYAKLERILNRMPTGHLLVMLDVCFGGTFDARVARSRDKDEEPLYTGLTSKEIISEKARLKTRRFISSGSKVKVPDGYPGLHSPFAYFVLEILRGKGGSNGYFTSTQLYARLQETLKSKPLSDGFGSNEAGSDFVFEYAPKK